MTIGDVFRCSKWFPWTGSATQRPGEVQCYRVLHIGKRTVTFEVRGNDGAGPKVNVTLPTWVAASIERRAES